MGEKETEEMLRKLENGELDEVLAAALREANKYKRTGISVSDLRQNVLEDLREKASKKNKLE